ncbi:MAG: serine protease [Anaerolineales bacterium]
MKKRNCLHISVIIFLCFILAACESMMPDEISPTPTPTLAPLSASEILAKISPVVVFIESSNGSGSGLLIEGGYILTNAHVVWPFEDVRVVFPGGAEFEDVPVVNWDLIADLAIAGPLETDLSPASLTDGEALTIGSDTYLIGYPGEVEEFPEPTIVRGLLSRIREWESIGITFFQTDASTAGGQSGGVLVTERGEIIGISGIAFTEAGYGVVASAADILARIDVLVEGEDVAGIGNRQLPRRSNGKLEQDITLVNIFDARTFVIREEDGEDVDIRVEGVENVVFSVVDGMGNVVTKTDKTLAGIEQETISIKNDKPLFLTVNQYSDRGGDFHLTSSHLLSEYKDVDDGISLSIGETKAANIDFPYDYDWYLIELEAGDQVNIKAESLLVDPIVVIDYFGARDKQVITDEDSGGGLFGNDAEVTYEAPHTGTYRIIVADQSSRATKGGYLISVDEPYEEAPTAMAPQPTATTVAGPYGPLSVYKSAQIDFSIQYPARFTKSNPRNALEGIICKLATACFLGTPGEVLAIAELDLDTVGLGGRSLDEYLKGDSESILGKTISIDRIEIQGEPAAIVTQSMQPEYDFLLQRFTYIKDDRFLITATYFGSTKNMTYLARIIDYSFSTIQITNDSSMNATTAAQMEATSTSVAQATATAIAPIQEILDITKDWRTVVKERFDSNKNYLWYTEDFEDEWGKVIIDVKEGVYIWDLIAYDDFYRWERSRVRPVSSFHLSADVYMKRGKTAKYGVLFRENEGDYYVFRITDNQYFNVAKRVDGEWTTLLDWTKSFVIKPYEVNRLSVMGQQSQFTFFINDQFVAQVEDDSILSGLIGFYAGLYEDGDRAVMEFDNVILLAP